MNKLDNLIPFNQRSAESLRAISVKGGIASGAARRAKRARIEQAKVEAIARPEVWGERFALFLEPIHDLREIVKEYRMEQSETLIHDINSKSPDR